MSITRNKAYSEILHSLPKKQQDVLHAIKIFSPLDGLTLFELVDYLRKPINQISGRVTELSKLGLIVDAGRRENPLTKKFSTVWKINKEKVNL